MKNLLDSSLRQGGRQTRPSKRRLAANRANARLSRGPVTAEGKARSSRNAITHALLCESILTTCDDKEEFERLATSFHDEYQPQTPVARALVDDLIGFHWRRMRIRTIEAEVLAAALEREQAGRPFNRRYLADAFKSLADNSHALDLLNRYDTRLTREIHRTLRLYHQLYQPDTLDCETNPIPHPDTPAEAEVAPVEAPSSPEAQSPSPVFDPEPAPGLQSAPPDPEFPPVDGTPHP